MNEEKMTEILFQINGRLGGIESKLDTLSESLLKHEARLTTLENEFQKHLVEVANTNNNKKDDGGFKEDLLKLLSKALIISLCSIGTLVGASGLISKMFGG